MGLRIVALLVMCLFSVRGVAQTDALAEAQKLAASGDVKKAAAAYAALYEQTPGDGDVYAQYLDFLMTTKDYKMAERVAEHARQDNPRSPLPLVDLGRVQLAAGKEKKAIASWEEAIGFINGDDVMTSKLAGSFSAVGRDDYAIKTYERARQLMQTTVLYGAPLAKLYAKTGNLEGAVNATLDASPTQLHGAEDTKASLLEVIGNDVKKSQQAAKIVVKRVQAQPENPFYADILIWLYAQRGDWEGALMQVQALDMRGQEGGRRLLDFARLARGEGRYKEAADALAIVQREGHPTVQAMAGAELLSVLTEQLEEAATPTQSGADSLARLYEQYFSAHPEAYVLPVVRDWAAIEGRYAGRPAKAVSILQKGLKEGGMPRIEAGKAKLELGDYQVVTGKVWEASLTYSQVDKDFREDVLGEEARFRNAKLAYYRGDFDWAQGQLSVLKASTSELIANDALALSVLITENVPPDSNLLPLRRYAYADLLLFQNKEKEAAALLDSVAIAFPEHPLKDDILFLKSKLLVKQGDYEGALEMLSVILLKHGEDVLADDALFQTGEIYSLYLKQPDKARAAYERILLDYPGSTLAGEARKKIGAL
jgi:tetratricopeptide (TPR) repeat protein